MGIKIHHLNCGTLCPFTGSFLAKHLTPVKSLTCLVCHCLLLETNKELILVDTGLGIQDIRNKERMIFNLIPNQLLKPLFDVEETAFHQVIKLGFNPKDVKQIIATHLDYDHVGGLADFPWANVHILNSEYAAAFHPKNIKQKTRYNQQCFSHNPNFFTYDQQGENWNGFTKVKNLKELPPEIFIVPLIGHSQGHMGIAIEGKENNKDKTTFFVGDAYLNRKQITGEKPPIFVDIYNRLNQEDYAAFNNNLEKLAELNRSKSDTIDIFCSHDPAEFHSRTFNK